VYVDFPYFRSLFFPCALSLYIILFSIFYFSHGIRVNIFENREKDRERGVGEEDKEEGKKKMKKKKKNYEF
jgi:membrane protein insertase Oxa1/YidC/SpoIIIJ